VTSFIEAGCVPMNGDWHGAGTLDRAQAILAEHPSIRSHDVYVSAVLGDHQAIEAQVSRDPDLATATGGLYDWDALTYLCFSKYLRLDRARASDFLESARFLLAHGASAQTGFYSQDHDPDPSFESVLYGAAGVAHDPDLVRLLVEHGADPNDGETAYHVPEGYDNRALMVLVESGKVSPISLITMMHRKLDWHDKEGVAWLLSKGADPNLLTGWGRRTLHHALGRDVPIDFYELILDHGADPLLADKEGRTAVMIAARVGRADVLDLFARRGFSTTLEGKDALLAACAHGDGKTARALAGANPNLVSEIEREVPGALAEAAGAGNTAAVELMLDLGFDIASRSSSAGQRDDTALHSAIYRARNETAMRLIARGAPLDEKNGRGETMLAYAVRAHLHSEWTRGRSFVVIEALLEAGASVEGIEPTGNAELDALLARYRKS
jgi:ankyrin repeat protein